MWKATNYPAQVEQMKLAGLNPALAYGMAAELGMQAASQAASGLIGTGMGLLLEGHNDRRQLRQQEKLQNLEIKGSKELTDYNAAKQLEMWKATNYPAQIEQMKLAGLNPALAYGMGGGGGVTGKQIGRAHV